MGAVQGSLCCGSADDQTPMVNMEQRSVYEKGEVEVEKQCDEPLVKKPMKKGKNKQRVERKNPNEDPNASQKQTSFSAQHSLKEMQKVKEKINITMAIGGRSNSKGHDTDHGTASGGRRLSGWEESFVKPVHPKTAAEEVEIRSIIKTSETIKVLIGGVNESGLQDLINAFYVHVAVQGDELIRQGDFGDRLYICREGNLDICVARPGPDGKLKAGDKGAKVLSVSKGDLFGELALMYATSRAATVTVTSPEAKLWALDRDAFKYLLLKSSDQAFVQYDGWLRDVEVLKPLNRFELAKLESESEMQVFENGEYIIRQGDAGDYLHIVEEGTCEAYIKDTRGKVKGMTYKVGDYFGEIALLNNVPRQASVRATGDGCSVMSVAKEDIMRLLGPIKNELKQSIATRYKAQAQKRRQTMKGGRSGSQDTLASNKSNKSNKVEK